VPYRSAWLLERGTGAAGPRNPCSRPSARTPTLRRTLPPIGEPFSNDKLEEVYAGITLHDNEAFALVLLPGDFEGSWQDAARGPRSRAACCPRASTCSSSGRT
jgi:hypothetical protein